MPAQINFDTDLDMFTFFTQQGWLPRLHNTLSGGAIAQAPGLLEDYPWGEIADCTFLDVGGGGGGLVALLLRKFPNMQAGILDLSKVIEHARTNFHAPNGQYTDVGPRVSSENLIAGDFLVSVPSFEVYTMKWCLHDWDDSKSLTVMRNIRDAIRKEPKSRLVILESLLTDGRMGRLSRYGDIMMMVSANGQERSEAEWMSLAERTGWKINRICPLRNSWPSAIELVPNWDSAPDTKGLTCSNGSLEAEETTVTAEPQATNGVNGSVTNRDVVAKGPSTISEMSYLEPWDASRAQPFFRAAPDAGFESTNFRWMDYSVVVTDARPCKNDFSLDVQGFSFVEDPEGLTAELSNALRLNDNENVKKEYYPRIDSMVKRATGASRVIIFDHTLRRRNPSMDSKQNSNGQEQPATVVSMHSIFRR